MAGKTEKGKGERVKWGALLILEALSERQNNWVCRTQPFLPEASWEVGEWLAPPGAARETFAEERTLETGLHGRIGALQVEPAERTLFQAERRDSLCKVRGKEPTVCPGAARSQGVALGGRIILTFTTETRIWRKYPVRSFL